MRCFIETEADISVLPRKAAKGKHILSEYKLYPTNNILITTYGSKLVHVDLGIRRKLDWTFVMADVKQAIIGADFLSHYGLLVDLKHRSLSDGTTSLKMNGTLSEPGIGKITTSDHTNPFADLLQNFSNITKSVSFRVPKNGVMHYIVTTRPPVAELTHRLVDYTQREHKHMLDEGICQTQFKFLG